MNIFAKIIEVAVFKKVTYYSLQKEGEGDNMFLEFVNRVEQNEALEDDLNLLKAWFKKIGDKYGAKEQYFRPEQAAHALPPPFRYTGTKSNLRLYCMRVNENAVILFSGDVKTAKTAQECPNVKPYFDEALRLTKKIDEAIKEKRISTDEVSGKLIMEPDFAIEL